MSRPGRLWTLYRRHPYCWWCGIRVRKTPVRRGRRPPADLATLDHLNTRNMYPDGRPKTTRSQPATTVLACWQCNQERGAAEQTDRDWIPPLMRTLSDMRRLTSDFYGLP
jgi:hypothetical protein